MEETKTEIQVSTEQIERACDFGAFQALNRVWKHVQDTTEDGKIRDEKIQRAFFRIANETSIMLRELTERFKKYEEQDKEKQSVKE